MAEVKRYKANTHDKKTDQGAGRGTKTGRTKGTLKKYRGQGGPKTRRH